MQNAGGRVSNGTLQEAGWGPGERKVESVRQSQVDARHPRLPFLLGSLAGEIVELVQSGRWQFPSRTSALSPRNPKPAGQLVANLRPEYLNDKRSRRPQVDGIYNSSIACDAERGLVWDRPVWLLKAPHAGPMRAAESKGPSA